MTVQQWDEFLDKLDFVHLCDRWDMLPLHWLDDDLPAHLGEAEQELVRGLLSLKAIEDADEKLAAVQAICREYRTRLSSRALALDSRLCPPGSRVTLRYLDPENLGEGDCLITTGAWDQLGYLVAELAHPGQPHVESVGEEPVRQEPGALGFRHIILFPDKGNPTPRAFRSQCERTLRQARGFGGKHFVITHLHPAQSGLADRFAAAELVSAVRQMLREGPGTAVDIMVFSHRNFEDYRHWFDSMKGLVGANPASQTEPTPSPESSGEAVEEHPSEMVETLRQLAKRSSEVASVATASVSRWFSSNQQEAPRPASFAWREPTFDERQLLSCLYLGRPDPDLTLPQNADRDPTELYVWATNLAVLLETRWIAAQEHHLEALEGLREWSRLAVGHSWERYFLLLERRLAVALGVEPEQSISVVAELAQRQDDLVLLKYLAESQEETSESETKAVRVPVTPGGSDF